MIKRLSILTIFFLGSLMIFSQNTLLPKKLLEKAYKNYRNASANPDDAFQQANIILPEARKLQNHEAELVAISTQCLYYQSKNNIDELMATARQLLRKAIDYRNTNYQVIAKIYFFNGYLFNELYDQAFQELEDGLKTLNSSAEDSLSILVKSNIYISFANYYSVLNDNESKLKYFRLSMLEHEKIADEKVKQKLRYTDYSNLALLYILLDKLDSAQYYVELSISKDRDYKLSDVQYINLSSLGEIALRKKDFKKAAFYYKKAESIEGEINYLNISNLYKSMIRIFDELGDSVGKEIYERKSDSLKLSLTKAQNIALRKLLNEREPEAEKNYYIFLYLALAILLFLTAGFIIRERIIKNQKSKNDQYPEGDFEQQFERGYYKLLKMLKDNDPAFVNYFTEVYPDFSEKLLNINPDISPSELEFCALLKLKIPTKEIARYRFIAPKTVQNKKYLIRQKLNIGKDIDLYQWFDQIK
ncbi:MAG: hypothetical protein CVU06_02100 [Bacteroidetes bacterium HGW-Bacteroidetes-22]|nr:MAG: hypothetical protein CVU06_02100 [Bacteroidetes bacterium HGW-Bacteroidetes-22]